MTELLHDIDAPSDAELISRVRGGDVAAYGELFSRHVDAARRLARQLVRGPDADDLVSDAFAKVLGVLQGGGGPDVAFRAYLLTAVRRLHVDKIRAGSKLQTSDDMEVFDAPGGHTFIVTGTVWQWLYNPGSGIQFMVNSLGWTDFKFALTTDRQNAIWAIIITGIWAGLLTFTGVVLLVLIGTLFGQTVLLGEGVVERLVLVPIANLILALIFAPMFVRIVDRDSTAFRYA